MKPIDLVGCEIDLPGLALGDLPAGEQAVRKIIKDDLGRDADGGGIGVVEERRQLYALMVLRLGVAIPDGSSADGFEFGHSLYGNASFEVIHFAFEFRGFATYHVLLNPSDPLVLSAVRRMIDQDGYFILTVDPDQRVTAFRAGLGGALVGLIDNFPRLRQSSTTAAQYQQALIQFRRQPDPPGTVLEWVCREDPAYLDLSEDRLELAPSAEDPPTPA